MTSDEVRDTVRCPTTPKGRFGGFFVFHFFFLFENEVSADLCRTVSSWSGFTVPCGNDIKQIRCRQSWKEKKNFDSNSKTTNSTSVKVKKKVLK